MTELVDYALDHGNIIKQSRLIQEEDSGTWQLFYTRIININPYSGELLASRKASYLNCLLSGSRSLSY